MAMVFLGGSHLQLGGLQHEHSVLKVGRHVVRIDVGTNREALVESRFGQHAFFLHLAFTRKMNHIVIHFNLHVGCSHALWHVDGNFVRSLAFLDFISRRSGKNNLVRVAWNVTKDGHEVIVRKEGRISTEKGRKEFLSKPPERRGRKMGPQRASLFGLFSIGVLNVSLPFSSASLSSKESE